MVLSKLAKYGDLGLLVARLGVGLMFIFVHGGPKILGGPERWAKLGTAMEYLAIGFAPTFWGFMASIAEFLGGLLLVLGLFFRPACLGLIATMFVAASMHLGRGDTLVQASHAIENFFFLVGILMVGPGKYSLDHYILNRRQPS
ncbi:MAG: DoxX family protein [candidate division KSB1 bacterium]|nr:DoxX family protein [candidate division KSB1 bacterium]MDQ7066314.1 DoxX family protein [candidate division KSB1 bacterium]